MDKISKAVWLVPIVALVVALLDMPFGYYQLLRVLIFCAAGFLAHRCFETDEVGWGWVLAGTAFIYNPFFKLALGREIWSFVNVATIAVLIAHFVARLKKQPDQRPETGRFSG